MNNAHPHRPATVYPPDAIAATAGMDVIDPAEARTLHGLFNARVARSPDKTAYIQRCRQSGQWVEHCWGQMAAQTERWRRALAADGFARGERAAIRMRNSCEWVLFDQACMAAGLVVTPLYFEDRADNIAYILEQTEARLLVIENVAMWLRMADELSTLKHLTRVVALADADNQLAACDDARVMTLSAWLAAASEHDHDAPPAETQPDALATIVYTSGTTGRPKGVMLSHANMLLNAHAGLKSVPILPTDKFLSFLPLSHMFERTVGYYLAMMAGASVAFNQSIAELPNDMAANRPSVMIAVPRIFERAHGAIASRLEQGPALGKWLFQQAVDIGWRRFEISQGRAGWRMRQLLWPLLNTLVAQKIRHRFGGNLRCVVSGGAPLAPTISRLFIALGIDILQGYGLTETGPTLSVNTLAKNLPASIGLPLAGAEIRLSASGELQARSPSVMLGYWQNEEATRHCIDAHGWFASGDLARIDPAGFIFIVGRLKDIIVTATGEKAPPADMEAAICDHPLFEQAMVLGEGMAFLSALIVLNPDLWPRQATTLGVDANDQAALASAQVENFILDEVAILLRDFPSYAAVRRVCVTSQPWTVQDGVITPTLKIKRAALCARFQTQIERMYAGRP